jgi:fatty-acyl-CoA synthase
MGATSEKPKIYSTTRLKESHWPADCSRPLRQWSIGQALRDVAREVPDRVALVEGVADHSKRRRWTYAQLLADAERTAAALLSRFEPGERVAVWGSNVPEYVLIQYGCALAGVIMVTVNPAYKEREFLYVMKQSEASGLFVMDEFRGYGTLEVARKARKDLPRLRELTRFADFAEFVAARKPSIQLPMVNFDDVCVIVYTSGTTGNQKGAMLHHVGALNSDLFAFERAGMEPGGICVNVLPMFHVGAGGLATYGTLMSRGTFVLAPGFDPAVFLELVQSERGSFTVTVPTMIEAILRFADRKKYDASALKNIICGGAMVEAQLVERVRTELGARITVVFGQTEVHGLCATTHREDTQKDQSETIGQALPHCEIKIVDFATGNVLPLETEGEICVRAYQTMKGYYRMPEETAKALRPDGWLHTGDLGTMDERGFVRIKGRLKDMIIRGGENIYPVEVESQILEHPKVLGVQVVGVPEKYWGEEVGAVVIARSASDRPSARELFEFCNARLTHFKVPRLWGFVEEFPMTATGKLQKFKIRDQIRSGQLKLERV